MFAHRAHCWAPHETYVADAHTSGAQVTCRPASDVSPSTADSFVHTQVHPVVRLPHLICTAHLFTFYPRTFSSTVVAFLARTEAQSGCPSGPSLTHGDGTALLAHNLGSVYFLRAGALAKHSCTDFPSFPPILLILSLLLPLPPPDTACTCGHGSREPILRHTASESGKWFPGSCTRSP